MVGGLVERCRPTRVRAGHRGPAQGRIPAALVGRQDAHPWGDHVNVRPEVGEVRQRVVLIARQVGAPNPPGLPSKSASADTVMTSSWAAGTWLAAPSAEFPAATRVGHP